MDTLVNRSNHGGSVFRPGRLALFWILCGVSLLASAAAHAQQAQPKPQASRAFRPVFPYQALLDKKGGWAELTFTVNHTGRAILIGVEGASDTEFARAWRAEIEAIEFIPPRPNGQPILSQATEKYFFPTQPVLDSIAQGILDELRKPAPAITPVAELDHAPRATRQPKPAYPWALRADSISGQAEVEFIIDRNGRSLFPRIVSSSHPDFGWAAATAIQQWRWEPPVKNGQKVDARMKTVVEFDINNSADMW